MTLPLLCLGTGIYHMLFEAKAQYVLPVLMYMLPYAAAAFAGGAEEWKKTMPDACKAGGDMAN